MSLPSLPCQIIVLRAKHVEQICVHCFLTIDFFPHKMLFAIKVTKAQAWKHVVPVFVHGHFLVYLLLFLFCEPLIVEVALIQVGDGGGILSLIWIGKIWGDSLLKGKIVIFKEDSAAEKTD